MITELSYDFYNSPDPVKILGALRNMQRARNRNEIFFDREDLALVAKAWERAAIAGVGDLEFLAEKDKFTKFRDRVIADAKEAGVPAVLKLDPPDWPNPRTINRAMKLLARAQIRTVH